MLWQVGAGDGGPEARTGGAPGQPSRELAPSLRPTVAVGRRLSPSRPSPRDALGRRTATPPARSGSRATRSRRGHVAAPRGHVRRPNTQDALRHLGEPPSLRAGRRWRGGNQRQWRLKAHLWQCPCGPRFGALKQCDDVLTAPRNHGRERGGGGGNATLIKRMEPPQKRHSAVCVRMMQARKRSQSPC